MSLHSLRHRNALVAALLLAASGVAWLGERPIPAGSVEQRARLVGASVDLGSIARDLPADRRLTVSLEIDSSGRPIRVVPASGSKLSAEQTTQLRASLLAIRFAPARHHGKAVATVEQVELDTRTTTLHVAGIATSLAP